MINRINLEHFKCFERLKLPLSSLTLLTGLNGAGKSTTIQALSLLHQTLTDHPNSPGLVLNGKNVALGSADEVIDKITGRDRFTLGLEQDGMSVSWNLLAEKDNLIARAERLVYQGAQGQEKVIKLLDQRVINQMGLTGIAEQLLETLRTLTFVSVDRIGPRETYPASSAVQQDGVGARGEYTPWFINQHEDLAIPEAMCREEVAPTLKRQVEGWLAFFFPGSGIEVEPIPRTNLLTMRLRTNAATNYHRPANVGYGLSHALPVLTACLGAVGLAAQDKRLAPLVLVENPELHLHPAGQSEMGVFLARAAAAGAQVIIETHSDHVLNGIRRAVKGIGGPPLLTPEQVSIHFFQARDLDGGQPQVISPAIDREGTLSEWPAGFFDQFDKDNASLIDW